MSMGRSTRKSEVELGYISGVFGVRGEVRLFLHNPGSYLLHGEHPVTLRHDGDEDRRVTLSARPGAGKRVLGRISGISDRDAAAGLKGWRVIVDRSALPELEADEYYVWQAEGAAVVLDGERVGRVRKVHVQGPVELFEIDVGDPEPWFVPSLAEFVQSFDREARVLHLHPDAVEE